MSHFNFPTSWRPLPTPSLTVSQKQWLTRSGALTQYLRQLGPLTLKVLAEYPDGAQKEEAAIMGLLTGSPVWAREITMAIDGQLCVVARSVTPLSASHSVWQGMRTLRTRPLADILYNDPTIIRSTFELARLNRQATLYRTVRRVMPAPISPNMLLARRSVFWRLGTPLLVAECFLPNFWSTSPPRL